MDLYGYKSISANIDDAAEGCGAWSCAGYALLKGAYAASTFGFAVVHDPVRDQYDEGKVTGGQYAARGIGGGAAMVAVNAAGVALGGVTGGVGATIAGTMARGSAVGAATAGANDAAVQGVNISAGLQKGYNGTQTATAMAVGGAFGGLVPAAAAGLNTQAGQAVGRAISGGVQKTKDAVNSAAQSVGGAAKGLVTREGGALATDGARITGQTVAPVQSAEPWKLTIGANMSGDGDKIGHAFISVKPPEVPAVTKGLWPVMSNGSPGFNNPIEPLKGMRGTLLDDSKYLTDPGSVLKTYDISPAQGTAALEKIRSIESRLADETLGYQLIFSQCATFACSVARAAGVNPPAAGLIVRPRKIYESIKNGDK